MLGTLLFSSRDQRYNGSQQKSSYPAGAQLGIYSNRPGGKERAREATPSLVFLLRQQRRQESATFLPIPLMNTDKKKMRNCPTRPSMSNHNVAYRLNGIHKNHI
jgi:hypothetical protein